MPEENQNLYMQEGKPKRKRYRRFEIIWLIISLIISVVASMVMNAGCCMSMSCCPAEANKDAFLFVFIPLISLGFFIILIRLLAQKKINFFIFFLLFLVDILILNYCTGLSYLLLDRSPKNESSCIFLRPQIRDGCYLAVFEGNGRKDPALCEKITPESDLYYSCHMDLTTENTKNYENIEILSPCKDALTIEKRVECIKDIAIEQDNIDLCGYVPREVYGITVGNPSRYYYECYKGIIFNGKRTDADLCKQQYKEYYHSDLNIPLNTCLFEVAVNKDDLSICQKAGPYDSASWCYGGIAIKRNDPTICNSCFGSSYETADCLTDMALKNDNLQYCQDREYDFQREECVSKVAIQRNDENLCSTLSRIDMRSFCLAGIAANKEDIEMCKTIPEEEGRFSNRDRCIVQIAIDKNDPQICNQITTQFSLNTCHEEFGIKK